MARAQTVYPRESKDEAEKYAGAQIIKVLCAMLGRSLDLIL